jgi:hypothetical protein
MAAEGTLIRPPAAVAPPTGRRKRRTEEQNKRGLQRYVAGLPPTAPAVRRLSLGPWPG